MRDSSSSTSSASSSRKLFVVGGGEDCTSYALVADGLLSRSRSRIAQYLACAVVPLASISVELHYLMDSVWTNNTSYPLFGILLLSGLLMLGIAALMAVLFT